MLEQIIFARAKPQIIRLVERYVYQADVSSLPDTQIIDNPTGLVEITIPYDGHQYFTRQAMSDIEIQFPQIKNLEQSHNEVKVRVGYLGLTNHDKTDLDDQYNLTLSHNIFPVDVKVRDNELHWPDSLLNDRSTACITINYKPQNPDFPPLSVKAKVFDANAISEEYHSSPEKSTTSLNEIMRQISEQVGFERDLILEFDLLLELPYSDGLVCKDFYPRLTRMSLDWPVATSHRLVRLEIDNVDYPFIYNPDEGVIEWSNIQFNPGERQEGKEMCLYSSPTIRLHVNEPGELYQWPQMYGNIEIQIPYLLSGLQTSYFDSLGMYRTGASIERKTIINTNLIINVEECFEHRLFSPQQHLQFPEVILETVRRADIVMLLKDERFTWSELRVLHPEQQYLIRATRPEGAGELTLWILVEGTPSQTMRERHIPGGESFTTNLGTGNTIIYMRGQLRGDSKRVVHVMNEIHQKLKDRFRHVQIIE